MEIYVYLIAGIILGLTGQLIRVVVGIKKQYDSTENPTASTVTTTKAILNTNTENPQTVTNKISTFWNNKQFFVSLFIGAVAGALASLFLSEAGISMNAEFYLAVIAAGYAGTDFIEGLVRTKAPKVTTEELKVVEEEKKKLKTETMANLKELKQFKDDGIITEDEFGEMKEKYIKSLLTSDEEKIKEQKISEVLEKLEK
ncbi:MAG: SHOCT domain-containing protein [Methanobacterium sp.]|jgi:hypothetical protein|nr:SHOCT domain-containing protein [Methanobacterium sp.]